MELIAGDGRIIKLAVIAYLVYELADLIVLLDGFLERLIGNIDSEIVMQRGQNMSPELIAEVFIVVLGVFKGTSVNSQKNLSFWMTFMSLTESRCLGLMCSWKRR